MASYTATEFLLDRANINDTVTKLAWYYDVRSEQGLADEVFAPEVSVDYSAINGAPPYQMPGPMWATKVVETMVGFDSTQHFYGHLLIDLPQPGAVSRPDRVKVLAQAQGNMVKKDARGGPLMQNGALAYFEMMRVSELEAKGSNPWRIASQKLEVQWEAGNWAVFGAAMGAAE